MPKWAEVYQRTNSAEAALRKLPEGSCWAERRLLRALRRRQDIEGGTAMPKWCDEEQTSPPKKRMRWGEVAREAFLALPRTIRALYAHSYVDRLWNLGATERRQMGLQSDCLRLVHGDLIDDITQPGTCRPVHLKKEEAAKASIFQLLLPRPGAGELCVSLPAHHVGQFMRSYLAYDGLDPEELTLEAPHTDDPVRLTGCMRHVLIRPEKLSWYLEPNVGIPETDWADQPGTKVSRAVNHFARARAKHDLDESDSLVLDFQLGPGQYATMAMREVMRRRPPKAPRHLVFSDSEAPAPGDSTHGWYCLAAAAVAGLTVPTFVPAGTQGLRSPQVQSARGSQATGSYSTGAVVGAAAVAVFGTVAAQRPARTAQKAARRELAVAYEDSGIDLLDNGKFAQGLVGAEGAWGRFEFDPLGFSTKTEVVPYLREAELKHGRIAMLAWLGMVVPDFVRLPGEKFSFEAVPVSIDAHEAFRGATGVNAQILFWISIVEFCCAKKVFEWNSLEVAGDYGLTNWFPSDEEGQKKMRLAELKNGRLAMLAFAGAVTQAALTRARGATAPHLRGSTAAATGCGATGAVAGGAVAVAAIASLRSVRPARTAQKAARRDLAVAYEDSGIDLLDNGKFAQGLVGAEGAWGRFEFDPLGFSTKTEVVPYLRE
ncbi:Pus7, partial [Symbiodinium microadriaticum]